MQFSGMPGIVNNTENKTSIWEVTCHYDNPGQGKEPASFMECMALFMLEKKQGWDSSFRPAASFFKENPDLK